MKRNNHTLTGHVAREQRRVIAEDNEIQRNERGRKGQIKVLDARLGEGVGATRERKRLAKAGA